MFEFIVNMLWGLHKLADAFNNYPNRTLERGPPGPEHMLVGYRFANVIADCRTADYTVLQ